MVGGNLKKHIISKVLWSCKFQDQSRHAQLRVFALCLIYCKYFFTSCIKGLLFFNTKILNEEVTSKYVTILNPLVYILLNIFRCVEGKGLQSEDVKD